MSIPAFTASALAISLFTLEKAEICSAVADRMIEKMTPATKYDAQNADGKPSTFGLSRMWNVSAHEAARLLMIYAVAHLVTGDKKYLEEYKKYAKESISQSANFDRNMAPWAQLQMQISLEAMLSFAESESERNAIKGIMGDVSALAAKRGGADRLELCADLIVGGTTPSLALLRQVKAETGLPVRALLRPRFGDFCYDRYELAQMAECAAELVAAGADGIVTGVLTPAGALDTDALRPIYAAARQAAEKAHRTVDCTLHRAFDVCCDPFAALEAAKQLGLATILTSGQAASAPQGAALLRQLVEAAGQEVEILVGAGVSAANIPALAAQTGARAFHLSGKQVLDSRMTFRREGVPMGLPGFSEFEIWQTSEENIRAARTALDAL